MAGQKVWALHDFEAENPDEVSFKAGECIVVLEKDDAYGDGWWQGTNIRGESGLFPFTYTTLDQSQVLVAAKTGNSSAEPGTTPQQASVRPGVMHSTMADIDNALTELQGDRRRGRKSSDGPDGSQASFTSERTADMTADDASETYNNNSSDDYASRSAAARAALAVNAQRDLQSAQEKERQEEQRRRAEAMKEFEEEEARQRELLLEKERERQAQAAAGTLDLTRDDKPKVAPIAGVDMSDESDSEGSAGDLDDFADKTHSPLFVNLASATAASATARKSTDGGSNFKNVVEPASHETLSEAAPTDKAPDAPHVSTPSASDVVAVVTDAAEPEIMPPPSGQLPATSAAAATTTPAASPWTTKITGGAPAASTALGVAAAGAGTVVITSRSVSPVPLSNRKIDISIDGRPNDQRSIDESSRGRASIAEESVAGGTGTIGTAATSLAGGGGGPATPKSAGAPFSNNVQSPSQSFTSAARPAGDPTEWTVEQVVEWGRSKGWDENSVLSKFTEHEITGDVLLEMDVNILKEIDIIAFGKRFQVANAIKELKKSVLGAEQMLAGPIASGLPGSPDSLGVHGAPPLSPVDALMPPLQSPRGPISGPDASGTVAAAGPGSWADAQSLNQRGADASYDSSAHNGSRSRPASSIGEAVSSNGQAFAGAGGVAAWQAQQANQRSRVPSQNPSDSYGRDDDDEPLAALAERQLGAKNRRSTRSNEDTLGALPASPRKRESAGSSSHSRGGGDRTSFFGIGQRNRKPPPKVMAPGSIAEDDRLGKGTLLRLGFARSSRAIHPQTAAHSDFKNNISLPTTSPNFDGNGDTTRRSRMSAQSGASGGTAEPGHRRETSIGSAGVGAQPNDWNAAAAGVGPGAAAAAANGGGSEGPVMARIRPVDLEGWMRKKGERYNSWKPRYLALKGSDLVILRDLQAEKIKGYVNMKGYKVIADEYTNPGKYGFKILHETEKPHYFSSDDPILVREWMKGLMKATIGRDHSFPVISSYNNATMSLKEAQRMNPPPRPPSPTSRARTQRAKARQNTDQLTARDAAILMNLSGGQPTAAADTNELCKPAESVLRLSLPSLSTQRMPKSQPPSPARRFSSYLLPGSKPQRPKRSPSRRIAPPSDVTATGAAGRPDGAGRNAAERHRPSFHVDKQPGGRGPPFQVNRPPPVQEEQSTAGEQPAQAPRQAPFNLLISSAERSARPGAKETTPDREVLRRPMSTWIRSHSREGSGSDGFGKRPLFHVTSPRDAPTAAASQHHTNSLTLGGPPQSSSDHVCTKTRSDELPSTTRTQGSPYQLLRPSRSQIEVGTDIAPLPPARTGRGGGDVPPTPAGASLSRGSPPPVGQGGGLQATSDFGPRPHTEGSRGSSSTSTKLLQEQWRRRNAASTSSTGASASCDLYHYRQADTTSGRRPLADSLPARPSSASPPVGLKGTEHAEEKRSDAGLTTQELQARFRSRCG